MKKHKMNSRIYLKILSICISCFLLLSTGIDQQVWAQSKTGTTIGQFLLIEPSARYAGMGNAAVAACDEITAVYYNPAAIGRLQGYGFQFTHSPWLADITYNYAVGLVQLGSIGNMFVNITSLNSGEMDVRTVEQPLGTGERYSVSNFAIGVGYGRQLTDRFSMGIQISYLQETIWHSSLSTVSFSLGTLFDLIPNGLRLGASVSNYGLPARYSGRDLRIQYDLYPDRWGDNSSLPGDVHTDEFPLPVLFRVGLTYPFAIGENHKVQVAINAYHPSDNYESIGIGGEWQVMNMLALRAGYQNLYLRDIDNIVKGEFDPESESGLTFGAGLQVPVSGFSFHFDYAWADYGRLESTQWFTAGLMF